MGGEGGLVGVVDGTTQSEPQYIYSKPYRSSHDRLISCPLPAAFALCDITFVGGLPAPNPPRCSAGVVCKIYIWHRGCLVVVRVLRQTGTREGGAYA